MLAITLDTNLLLDWRSRILGLATDALADGRGERVERLVWSLISGSVFVWASNRVLYPDVNPEDRAQFRSLLSAAGIRIGGSSFRIGVSPIGGLDALGGRAGTRSQSEIAQFRSIAGADPAGSPGARMSNRIADYDSLFDHFCARRDVFVTEDRRAPFNPQRRDRFERELGLVVRSLDEFVAGHPHLFGQFAGRC